MAAQHTILVVDDDFALRRALCQALETAGFRTVSAADGQEALKLLRSIERPDMILSDLDMPTMDGFQLSRELVKDPSLSAIPVMLLTGLIIDSFTSAALSAIDLVTKPLNFDSLIARIRQQLEIQPG